MVAIAMCDDCRRHGLGRDLGDFGLNVFGRIDRSLGVHHDDAVLADDDPGVSAGASLGPVNVAFDIRNLQRYWLLLSTGRSAEHAKSRRRCKP
jgi:hypothetical protein